MRTQDFITVDHLDNIVINARTGTRLCLFHDEMAPRYTSDGKVISLAEPTGRIVLELGDHNKSVQDWDEAARYLMQHGGEQMMLPMVMEKAKPEVTVTGFQCGDQIKIKSDNKLLMKLLSKTDAKTKKDKAKTKTHKGVVNNPNGPGATIGVMIDGEFHLIDETDAELIYESFDDLREMRYFSSSSGVSIPVSAEEDAIIAKCREKTYNRSFDEREKELARRLVTRGVLSRDKDNQGMFFAIDNQNLTRI